LTTQAAIRIFDLAAKYGFSLLGSVMIDQYTAPQLWDVRILSNMYCPI
jgi:hypothetical protein